MRKGPYRGRGALLSHSEAWCRFKVWIIIIMACPLLCVPEPASRTEEKSSECLFGDDQVCSSCENDPDGCMEVVENYCVGVSWDDPGCEDVSGEPIGGKCCHLFSLKFNLGY